MRKLIFLLFITINIILLISCDDQVDPKTDFKDVYALNCVIRGDTSFQVATITRSYNVEGFDPLTNTNDPFIKGAVIKLTYKSNGRTYTFRDTTIARPDDSRYSTPMSYYYIKDFRPTTLSPISIEATLPNGKILRANSTTFFASPYLIQNLFYSIPIAVIGNSLVFNWTRIATSNNEKIYYVPELVIRYAKIQNGTTVEMQKKVPLFYINGDIPFYPSIQGDITSASFDTLTIRRSIEEISSGDPDKQNYIIHKAVFRLLITDKNLAVYYSAQKTFLDEFSVRVTQPEFTNINGGLGIFGTLTSTQVDVPIKASYIRSFGYLPN